MDGGLEVERDSHDRHSPGSFRYPHVGYQCNPPRLWPCPEAHCDPVIGLLVVEEPKPPSFPTPTCRKLAASPTLTSIGNGSKDLVKCGEDAPCQAPERDQLRSNSRCSGCYCGDRPSLCHTPLHGLESPGHTPRLTCEMNGEGDTV